MVKKEIAETPQKSKAFKRGVIKVMVLAALVGAGYGVWKNPIIWEQIKGAFERQPEEDVYQPQINKLQMQLRQLQKQLGEVSAQIQAPDLSAIENKVGAIEKMNLNVINSKADVATVLGLLNRLDKAEQKLDKMSAVTDDSALILTGVMLVKDSAERGGNFEYEAEVLNQIVADNPKQKAKAARLENFAKDGIVSERQLVKDFATIYEGLLKEQKSDFDQTWKDRINSKLSEFVQIKKVNAEAPEFAADKGLEKVLRLVDEGHLQRAVAELQLPQNAEWMKNPKLQEWVKKVQVRDEFYDIIRSMSAGQLGVMKVRFLKKPV